MSIHSDKKILVTGATGQQGGAVTRHLLKDGWKVRALVRDLNNEAAKAVARQGAELVKGDLNERASIQSALEGAYGVFSFQNYWRPDIRKEGELRQGKNVADAARATGVKHLVYSSVGAAHRGMGQEHFATKWEIEQYTQQLGLPHTILRPAAFMENFNWSRNQILTGTFTGWGLRPGKALQMIAVDDIGAFVAMAFAQPQEFLGKTIELAGDELTESQIAETFAKVIGRPVKVVAPQMAEGQQPTPEQIAFFQFFNGRGYDADIPALRAMYPPLQTLEQYLRRNGWENAEPVPIPEEGGWLRRTQ
jgi:uncharacterized protein YbjT (DUF2867 family)